MDRRADQLQILPTSGFGWMAVVLTGLAWLCCLALPFITTMYREEYPITDTFLMPVIGLAALALAAAFNVLVVWRGHQRSVLSLLCLLFTVIPALFFTVFVVGEGLTGT